MRIAAQPVAARSTRTEAAPRSARPAALLGLLLFAVVFAVFLPAVRNDFVNYDDPVYVTENAHVRGGPTWANLKWALTTRHGGNFHPLTWLSHQIDWRLYGPSPAGHHLTSVALHALNAVLLFVALRLLTGSTWRSVSVALLFGLHPLRVESVAWVSERKDVLSGVFFMMVLIGYAAYVRTPDDRRSKRRVYYGLTLGAFACGLMSKPILVTVPLILLLLDWWPLHRVSVGTPPAAAVRRAGAATLLLEKVPFVILAAACGVVTYIVQRSAGAMYESLPVLLRVENAAISCWRYLGKLSWPADLAVYYPHVSAWPAAIVAACAIGLTAVSAVVWVWRRRAPFLAFGWFWYLLALAPVIGLVQVGSQSMADRYTYLSTIGVLIAIVWGAHAWLGRNRPAAIVLLSVVAVAATVAADATRRQIRQWKDSETLFRDALAVTVENTVALNNLARALGENGRLDEAAEQYRRALTLDRDNAYAAAGLGVIAMKRHDDQSAVRYLQEALRHDPGNAATHFDLGLVVARNGSLDDAIREFEAAVKLSPDNPDAQNNLGGVLLTKERFDEAIPHCREAIRLRPGFAKAYKNLGIALVGNGQLDEGIARLRDALTLQPDLPGAQEWLRRALEIKAATPDRNPAPSQPQRPFRPENLP